jgi:hypothetical protein
VDNGVEIELQLLYGNALYNSPSGKLPDSIIPALCSLHTFDRSLYSIMWTPRTAEQIDAFMRYVQWTAKHVRGRIHFYELWNEQDGAYWNPEASLTNAEEYGRLLKYFPKAVHEVDPTAKIVYGGLALDSPEFAKRSLDACQCASEIDVFTYHTYPWNGGQNLPPESMDYGSNPNETPQALREMVRNYPGVRKNIVFWDNEFNYTLDWSGFVVHSSGDESIQAKYVPRGYLYNHAAGVKTFVWELIAATDGPNNFDRYGLIHGLWNREIDFTACPVLAALQNTNAVFADTRLDPTIEVSGPHVPELLHRTGFPFMAYGFRSSRDKAVIAYWLAAHSLPGSSDAPFYETLTIKNSGIKNPVLLDVVSGEIRPLQWKKDTTETLESLPIRDSIMAITDATYFDCGV